MWNRNHGTGVVVAVLVLGAVVLGLIGGTSAYFSSRQVTGPHGLSTWQCVPWIQTTQADFLSDIGVNVSTSASPGNVTLGNQTLTIVSSKADTPFLYGMQGSNQQVFAMYNLSNNTWVSRANLPFSAQGGGSLTTGDAGNLYALDSPGASGNKLVTYNISTNTWPQTITTPQKYGGGGSITHNGTEFIFIMMGGNSNWFYQYSMSSATWTQMANTPGNVIDGGAQTYDYNNNIFAFQGGTTAFWMYNTLTNVWSVNTSAPNTVGAGGALTYAGNGNIYAFRGGGTTTFWRYNISTSTWSPMASAPGAVNYGGALVYTSRNGNISAFQGGTNAFWQYNLTSNSWSSFANFPVTVGEGGGLAYQVSFSTPQYRSVYVPFGNLTSVVNDTGKSGTIWNSMSWTGTTIAGVTNITFRVRASDSSSALPTLPWIDIGWPSPVYSGLPTGRYFQWQAVLTTSDLNKTPVLEDVILCYT